jgi:hypothetical protein
LTPAAMAKRVAEIEAAVASIPVPAGDAPPWLSWTTDRELTEMEQICTRAELASIELTQAEVMRILAVECAATARMLAGEPAWSGVR